MSLWSLCSMCSLVMSSQFYHVHCMCFQSLMSMSDPSMYVARTFHHHHHHHNYHRRRCRRRRRRHRHHYIKIFTTISISYVCMYISLTVSHSLCRSIVLWANVVCCFNLSINKAYLTLWNLILLLFPTQRSIEAWNKGTLLCLWFSDNNKLLFFFNQML